MIEFDEWEESVKARIKSLESDHASIRSLSYRIKCVEVPNSEDIVAVEAALSIISKEIEKLKADLYIHQLLKNSEIIIP